MIETLIEAGKFLIGVFSEKKKMKKQRKDKLSSTLKTIGDLIHSVALDLQNNTYPHGSCAAMEALSDTLIQELDEFLNDPQKQILNEALHMSTKLESMYAQRNDPEYINKIEQASGHFYAVSILVSL
jgi:hypothetical protein